MELLIAGIIVAVLSLVSLVFYRLARNFDWKSRIAVSIHGLALALVIVYGLVVDAVGLTGSSGLLQIPAVLLFLSCAASVVYSCVRLRQRWGYLLLHLVVIILFMPTLYLAGITLVGWT